MRNMRFKVGDRVKIKSLDWYNENKTIHGDIWFDNAVFVGGQSLYCGCELTIRLVTDDSYYVIENDYYWTDEMIEGLVEEEAKPKYEDEVNGEYDSTTEYLVRPSGYIFKDENDNVINATKIVLEKKKKEYPTTIEECCEILGLEFNPFYTGVKRQINYKDGLLHNLKCLLIYRDAYWKIAGEEMGLGKPWVPDWSDEKEYKYVICRLYNDIVKDRTVIWPKIFAFPTPEMRDAFKENFNPDIEFCKEFL